MSINTENSASKVITIEGILLSVPTPFVEGHTLRANEAAVLNQTYSENIRNNTKDLVKKAKELAGGDEDAIDMTALQASIDTYISTYDFGVRSSGGRTGDPVQREAILIAVEAVKNAIVEAGFAVKDYTVKAIKEYALQAIDTQPEILIEAKSRIAARSTIPALSFGAAQAPAVPDAQGGGDTTAEA